MQKNEIPAFGVEPEELNEIKNNDSLTVNEKMALENKADIYITCQNCDKRILVHIDDTTDLYEHQNIRVRANCESCGSGNDQVVPYLPVVYR